MVKASSSLFVGKERSRVFRDCIAEESFFFVFEAEEGLAKAEGHEFMSLVKEAKKKHGPLTSLDDLETFLQSAVFKHDIPAHFSVSVGSVYRDIMYVKTVGAGEVHLRRGADFVRLIHGDKTASGFVHDGDMVVFTTSTFRALIENEEKLKDVLDKAMPDAIVEKLEEYYDNKDDKASLGLFVSFKQGEDVVEDEAGEPKHTPNYHKAAVLSTEVEEEPDVKPATERTTARPRFDTQDEDREKDVPIGVAGAAVGSGIGASGAGLGVGSAKQALRFQDDEESQPEKKSFLAGLKNPFAKKTEPREEPEEASYEEGEKDGAAITPPARRQGLLNGSKQSRMIIIGLLIVIGVIFIWSVVFGYQRRKAAEDRKKIDAVTEIVNTKIVEAEENAYLNMDRSISLIGEAKQEVKDLRTEIGKGYDRELQALEKKVTTTENEIVQKEEKEPEEFYDLALEDQEANGNLMYLEGDKIAILDRSAGVIYNFSADKKSIEKSENSAVSDATTVGMVKGALYFFTQSKGLFMFTDDTKVKNVIKDDSSWGNIKDIAFFAGNVYMLDPDEGDIYKYVVVANGFGEKQSYFNGAQPDLEGANSLKIDASIYIGLTDSILKYTRGESDSFSSGFPSKDVTITKIFTDEETDNVYAWDKKHATMYVLDKQGSYKSQIKASILAKAADFVVYNNEVLLLSGSKIYKLTEK